MSQMRREMRFNKIPYIYSGSGKGLYESRRESKERCNAVEYRVAGGRAYDANVDRFRFRGLPAMHTRANNTRGPRK